MTGTLTINKNTTGLVLNRDAVTNYNGIYYATANTFRWFVGMRENLSSNNHIHYSEQIAQDILTLNVANGNATIYGNLAIGNSAEVMGLIQMGASGRYGMGISSAYTNVHSHNSGNGVRLGYYDGTTFTARMTIPNGGAPLIDSNVILHAGNYNSYALPLSGGTLSGDLGMGGNRVTYSSYNSPNMIVAGSGDNNWAFGSYYDGGSQYWMQVKFYGTGDDARGFRVLDANGGTVRFRVNGAGNAYANNNLILTTANYSSYSLPLSGGVMTGALVNNTDGAVILESNASENNNWLWKEAAKQWGLFWFNRGTIPVIFLLSQQTLISLLMVRVISQVVQQLLV